MCLTGTTIMMGKSDMGDSEGNTKQQAKKKKTYGHRRGKKEKKK